MLYDYHYGCQAWARMKAMMMFLVGLCCFLAVANGFLPTIGRRYDSSASVVSPLMKPTKFPFIVLAVSRYGPPSLSPDSNGNITSTNKNNNIILGSDYGTNDEDAIHRKQKFRVLLEETLCTTKTEHLPRLLGNNMDLILSLLDGSEGAQVVSELLEEAIAEGEEQYERTAQVVEMILGFAEDFVHQANEMDLNNKRLLGKIIQTMRSQEEQDEIKTTMTTAERREELLDELMEREKQNFTPGFFRHIEGECDRIANAAKMTPESARLLEILRIIQTRVLEELGKDMGECAVVLGQLMGYDDQDELLGVLDAGLTVRGRDFAVEMKCLTEEALDGFRRVHGGVDVELVERVTMIDQRLQEYLEETNEFQ